MARKNALGLELSFHPSGRWLKRGKEFEKGFRYFGPGKSDKDLDSYKLALANYENWKREQAASTREGQTKQRVYDAIVAINKGIMNAAQLGEMLAGTKAQGGFVEQYLTARADQETRQNAIAEIVKKPTQDLEAAVDATALPKSDGKVGTVAQIVDLFDAHNEARNRQRHINQKLKDQGKEIREQKGQCIGDETLGRLRRYSDRFKAQFGRRAWIGTEADAADLMAKGRELAAKSVDSTTGGGMADHDELIKFQGALIRWAYEGHHLVGLPRNIKALTQKFNVTSSKPKAIPLADIKTLFTEAADDMRTWIALGLNCGFYSKDISDLRGRMIGEKYLDFWREKTINTAQVNVKYKLWAVTRKLIERSRTQTDADDRLWRTRKGHTLVHTSAKRTRGKTSVIRTAFAKLCVECEFIKKDEKGHPVLTKKGKKIAMYNWTHLRDTGATMVENIAASLTDLYLAHRDPRMARLYVDGKMVDTKPLDDVMNEMEARIDLPTLPVRKPKWNRKRKTKVA